MPHPPFPAAKLPDDRFGSQSYQAILDWLAHINSFLEAAATVNQTIGTSLTDVTNCLLNLDRDGYWEIDATFDIEADEDVGAVAGKLVFDGVAQTASAIHHHTAGSGSELVRITVSQHWIVLVESQPKVAKLQHIKANGAGSATCYMTHTKITAKYLQPVIT